METEEKIARVQTLLREAFALLNDVAYVPNVRGYTTPALDVVQKSAPNSEPNIAPGATDLALLSAHVGPTPLPAVSPIPAPHIPPPIEEVE